MQLCANNDLGSHHIIGVNYTVQPEAICDIHKPFMKDFPLYFPLQFINIIYCWSVSYTFKVHVCYYVGSHISFLDKTFWQVVYVSAAKNV